MTQFIRVDTIMKIGYYCGYDNIYSPVDFFSKIQNLTPELLEQVFDYLGTLDILSKNIMNYFEYEDIELYDAWRIRLCKCLDIPAGVNIASTAEITISLEDYNNLLENSLLLNLLENRGVDNWEGYDECYEEFLKQTQKND